jgi:hypothetical protein
MTAVSRNSLGPGEGVGVKWWWVSGGNGPARRYQNHRRSPTTLPQISGQPSSSEPDTFAEPVEPLPAAAPAPPDGQAQPSDEPKTPERDDSGAARWDPTRVACHLAILCAFGVALIRSLDRGWAAVSDDAVISIRSWEVFSHQSPLVGQFTQLSSVFDVGPLQYWLLAVPVRLDPTHGALWGSAFWCVIAAMVAVEAVRAAAGRAAGVATALIILWALWWMPGIADNPVWNPYLGDMFFLAAIAASYATLCGCRRYWPIAVVAGSVATQCHLMFSLACVTLVILGGAVLVVRAVRGKYFPWSVLVGLIAGAACWVAPIIQQLTTTPGNLSQLLKSQGQGARTGVSFGLRALGASTFPRPIWTVSTGAMRVIPYLDSGSYVVGVVLIVLIAAIAVLARSLRNRTLFYLAVVSLVSSLCLVATMANFVAAKDVSLGYVVALCVPVGSLAWLTVVWGAVTGIRYLIGQQSPAEAPAHAPPKPVKATAVIAARWGAVAALVLVSVLVQLRQSGYTDNVEGQLSMRLSSQAALRTEQLMSRGTVNLLIAEDPSLHNPLLEYDVVLGLAWRLRQQGWHPLVPLPAALVFGPHYQPYAVVLNARSVYVKLGATSVTVKKVHF